MALTSAVLKANAGLAALTDEQVRIIEELSRNDENTVIGNRIGELHGQYDADVLAVTGVAKRQGEKSYDYVKRILGDYKQKAAGAEAMEAELGSLKAQVEKYKQGGGGDPDAERKLAEASRQLADAKKQLQDTQELLGKKEKAWKTKYDALDGEYQRSLVEGEFGKALQGMKFKGIYPESVQKTLVDAAQRSILATAKPDWVEENGTRKLVFRDKEGNIMNNPENRLNPYTAGELLRKELKEVLDTGRRQTGTGTQGGTGREGSVEVDLTGIRTQVEADDAISKHLMSLGYTRGSRAFAEKAMEMRKENGVEKLPVQ